MHLIYEGLGTKMASEVVPVVNSLPVNAGAIRDVDPLEDGMATHSSSLAWRIPRTEEPGGLQYIGLQSRTWLKQLSIHVGTRVSELSMQWVSAAMVIVVFLTNFSEIFSIQQTCLHVNQARIGELDPRISSQEPWAHLTPLYCLNPRHK